MTKEKYIQICPKCGSIDVESGYLVSPQNLGVPGSKKLSQNLKNNSGLAAAATPFLGWQPSGPTVYICKSCDYYGICPEVGISKIKEFQKKIKKLNQRVKNEK